MSQGERILFQRFLLSIALIAVVTSALIMPKVAQATPHSPGEVPQSQQTTGSRTFSETGFTVANYFLKTWNATPNALFVYGLPISQPFIEQSFSNPGEFYRVQYFERAILEEHPENAGGQYYILGRLLGWGALGRLAMDGAVLMRTNQMLDVAQMVLTTPAKRMKPEY
jgi:hypothetical protein